MKNNRAAAHHLPPIFTLDPDLAAIIEELDSEEISTLMHHMRRRVVELKTFAATVAAGRRPGLLTLLPPLTGRVARAFEQVEAAIFRRAQAEKLHRHGLN